MKGIKAIFRILGLGLLSAMALPSYAQPANDNCSGAITVQTDSTCYNGTTVAANDSWIGSVGCQTNGSHPDVWYSFTATGANLSVSVTAGTITGNIEFILVGASGNCSGFTLAGSLCGPSPLSGNITGLQPGTTYYYTISSSGNTGTFTVCVKNFDPVAVSGQDCSTAAILCNGNAVTQPTSNAGYGTQEVSPANSCWGGNGERQSRWFKFTVGCSGTLEFNINPASPADDYDWALWDISSNPSNCTNKGNSIACNWSGCPGSTGLSTCAGNEPGVQSCGQSTGGDPCGGGNRPRAWTNWSAPGGGASNCVPSVVNVTAGSTYALLVDNFSASNSGFSLTFGGACGGGTAKLGPNAEFSLQAGSCGTYSFTKTCQTTNSVFLWSFGDGTTSALQNPTHTYTTAGTFTISLQVTDALGCVDTYSQTVNIQANPAPTVTSPVSYCQGAPAVALTATGTGSLLWYTAAAGGTGSATAPVPSTTNPGTVSYFVSQVNNGCESPRAQIDVIVETAPVMTSANATAICSGSQLAFQLTSNIPAAYTWVAADNPQTTGESTMAVSTAVINNTIINNSASPQIVQYTVTPVSVAAGCAGTSQTVSVTVNPGPSLTNPLTYTQCSGVPLNISLGSTAAGTIFNWVAANNPNTNGETTNPQNSSNITDNINNATTTTQNIVYNIAMAAGSCRDTQIITVSVNPIPLMTSTANIIACTGTVINIPFNATIPSTYAWIAADNVNVLGESTTLQNSSSLSNTLTLAPGVITSQVINYSVTPTATATGCSGPTQAVTITIHPIPFMTSQANSAICSGATLNFQLTASIPSLFSWIASNNPNVTGESTTQQSGSVINNTLVNTTNTLQTVVYSVTPRSATGNCQGGVQFVAFNISPTAVVSYSGADTICSGSSLNISLSSNIAGSTFSWNAIDNNNTTGETLSTQNSNNITDLIINNSATPQTVKYQVRAIYNGCPGPIDTIDVHVNPAPLVTNAADQNICSNASVGLALTGNIPGMSFTWQANANAAVTGESTTPQNGAVITDVLVSNSGSVETVVYSVSGVAGSCPGIPQLINVNVAPQPVMTSGNTVSTCSGVSLNFPLLSNITSNFTWTAADNLNTAGESLTPQSSMILNDLITNLSLTSQNVNYTVTPVTVQGNCPGASQTVTVTVNPAPQMTSPQTATVCSGTALNIILTSNIPSVYSWVAADNSATFGESTVPQNSGTINNTINNFSGSPQVVTYTVTPTSSVTGCQGIQQTVQVTVNTTGIPNFAYPLPSYCQNGINPTPSISGTLGGTFSASPAGLVIDPATGIISLSASAANNYIITYTVGIPCPSSGTFNLQVKANPDPTFSYPTPLCAMPGAPHVFPSPNTGNTDFYISTVGLAFISNRTGEINPSASIPGSYVIQHTIPGTPGCNAVVDNVSMTIVAMPSPANAGNPQSICGNTAVLAGNNPASGTGLWTVISGNGNFANAGQGNTSVSGLVTGNNTLRWTISTAPPCPASIADVVITSNPVPDPAFSYASGTFCLNSTNPVPNITGTAGGTFSASPAGLVIDPNTGLINLNTSVPGNYSVTYSFAGACPASSDFAISVIAPPTAGFNYAGSPYCMSGSNPSPSLNPGAMAGNFSSSPAGLVFSNASTGEIDFNASSAGVYSVTNSIPAANGCPAASANAAVTLVAAPATSNAGSNQVICSSNAVLNANNPISGTGLWTLVSGTAVIANPSSPNSGVSGMPLGSHVFRWTITTAVPCAASESEVTIINSSGPVMTSSSTAGVCSGLPLNFILTSDVPAVYQWSAADNPATTGESLSPQSGSTINDIIVNPGNSNQIVSYTISPSTASGCPGTPQVLTVTVYPVPVYSGPLSDAVCSGSPLAIALTAVIPSSFTWQATDNPNVSGESTTIQNGAVINDNLINNSTGQETVQYTVIPISLAGACPGNQQQIAVTVNPVPAVTNAGPFQVCSGTALNIPLTATVPAAFTWMANDNPSTTGESLASQNTNLINDVIINPSGVIQPVQYSVSPVSIAGNCPGNALLLSVNVLPPDNSAFSYPQSVICRAGALLAPSITGLPGGIFSSTPAGLSISSANGSIDPSTSISNAYTVTYSTNGTCPSASSVPLTIIDAPQAGFSYSGPYCNSAANPLPTLNAGSAAGLFSAIPAGLVFVNPSTGEINLSASLEGTYAVTNTIAGSANCPAAVAGNTVVIVQAPSQAVAGPNQSICGSVTGMNAVNPVFGTGTWSLISGAGTIVSPNSSSTEIRSLAPGSNVFQWTVNANPPCPASISQVTINSVSKPVITNSLNESICSGGTTSIPLTSSLPSTYLWYATDNPMTTGESLIPNTANVIANTITNLSAADQPVFYTVIPTSLAGNCQGDPATVIVAVLTPPKVNAGNDTIAIRNQPHQLQATGALSYVWSPAGPLNNAFIANPLAILSSDTRFILEGTSGLGCKGYDTVFVKVYEGPAYYIPNAFTPNGDGLNDIFTPIPVGIVSTDWFRVYNRYGQLVFESREWMKGWDGRYRGIMQPTGSYVWVIKGKSVTGKEISAKGSVLLIH